MTPKVARAASCIKSFSSSPSFLSIACIALSGFLPPSPLFSSTSRPPITRGRFYYGLCLFTAVLPRVSFIWACVGTGFLHAFFWGFFSPPYWWDLRGWDQLWAGGNRRFRDGVLPRGMGLCVFFRGGLGSSRIAWNGRDGMGYGWNGMG